MPLFMAICGYFAWNTAKLSPANFIKKKFIQLLLPAFLYILIQICFIRPWGGVLNAFYTALYNVWFLKSAFICFCLFYISTKLSYKTIPIGFLLTLIATQFTGMFSLDIMYPSFIAGALLNKQHELITRHIGYITIVTGIIFVLMMSVYDGSFWQYNHTYNNVIIPLDLMQSPHFWWIHSYRLVIGIIGSVFFFTLFELLFSRRNNQSVAYRNLSFVGQLTLGIYLLQSDIWEGRHGLSTYLNFEYSWFFNLLICPTMCAIIMILCVLVIMTTGKFAPLVSKIIFNYKPAPKAINQKSPETI